jgi:hypothetical protein
MDTHEQARAKIVGRELGISRTGPYRQSDRGASGVYGHGRTLEDTTTDHHCSVWRALVSNETRGDSATSVAVEVDVESYKNQLTTSIIRLILEWERHGQTHSSMRTMYRTGTVALFQERA